MKSSGKTDVEEFWNRASCGETLYLAGTNDADYENHSAQRYALEPYILDFARFAEAEGKKVLEIGIGLGADHQMFAASGCELHGIDLTDRAIRHTRQRLAAFGLKSELKVGDAEHLDFPNESFDIVYSWGVLHHSPNTPAAIREVWRVLKTDGVARIMIYHTRSLVGMMLWVRYGLLRLRPWLSLKEAYSRYLESPGTKAYTVQEAGDLFALFRKVQIETVLTHGDLLESAAGQRHQGLLLSIARMWWPRWLFRRFMPGWGLFMLIEARK